MLKIWAEVNYDEKLKSKSEYAICLWIFGACKVVVKLPRLLSIFVFPLHPSEFTVVLNQILASN